MKLFHPVYWILIFLLPYWESNSLVMSLFARPAASLAGIFLGLPLTVEEGGYLLHHPSLPVLVTGACSGFTFFCILLCLTLALSVGSNFSKKMITTVKFLPFLWAVTLISNGTRIICGFYVGLFSHAFLPSFLWGASHLATGVFVFVPVLFTVHLYLERKFSHE